MKRDAAIILPPQPDYKSKDKWRATCVHTRDGSLCEPCLQLFVDHNNDLNHAYSLSRQGHVAAHITRDEIVRNQTMIDNAQPSSLDTTSDDLDFAGIEEGSDATFMHSTGFAQTVDHDADVDYESAIMEPEELPTDGEPLEEDTDGEEIWDPFAGETDEDEELDIDIDPFDATNVDDEDDGEGDEVPEDFDLD